MSPVEIPCAGCGATPSTALCVCVQVDRLEAALAGDSFFGGARILRRLGSTDLRRVVTVLQYRAHDRGYREGRKDGRRREGENGG